MADLGRRFRADVDNIDTLEFCDELIGFTFRPTAVITNRNPEIISTQHHWGLIPSWSRDEEIRKNTLNAKIETLFERASFRDVTSNRCLVLATAFFEWRWNDEKGKSKQKYSISSAENEIFCLAGIFSEWKHPEGSVRKTFSIVTTDANEPMQYIHNMKKRMPVMLKQRDEASWLDPKNSCSDFAYPNYNPELVAFPV